MSDYFHRLLPSPPATADLYRAYLALEANYVRQSANPQLDRATRARARNQARLVRESLLDFQSDLTRAALKIATLAQKAVLAAYDANMKRPDTPSEPHLRDLIFCDVVHTPLAAGVVGIGRLDELDKARYWKAQELGLKGGFVGRELHGWFFGAGGGATAPNPPEFRRHPVFRPNASAPVKMTIRNPIQAKHFLQRGVNVATPAWLREMRAVEADAIRDMRAIGGQRVPGRGRGSRGASVRRGRRR